MSDVRRTLNRIPAPGLEPEIQERILRSLRAATGEPKTAQTVQRWPTRRAAIAACAVMALGAGTTLAATGLGPFAYFSADQSARSVFTANPLDDTGNDPANSVWHQRVVTGSVRPVASARIPGVGIARFWYARTRQHGWCGAVRLPDGAWSVVGKSPLDAGGDVPGCQPSRAQLNSATGRPVYVTDGFDFREVDINTSASRGGYWRIQYGIVRGKGKPVRVIDRASGQSAPVKDGRFFALAIPDYTPETLGDPTLVALDRSGRIVARIGAARARHD